MLSIGKLALGQQRYYEQQVAQGGDDYYSGRGEAPGEWAGGGAQELGLAGRVSAGQFNALLEGRDPRAPQARLRAGVSEPTIAAFDLTFSAPKSVSVLFAVGPAEVSAALVEAHEEAVRGALGYLEEAAVFVRRGAGGARFEHAGGLIAAAYRHRMSRALDPQLHTHVVGANLARGEDGRYTALHHPSLYRAARTAGYLYQSHLRSLVRDRLGLEWGPVRKGAAELAELPVDVLRVFSQRRAQVEAAVAEREAELGRPSTRAEREAWGAIATRDRKQYGIDTHTWREEITARAAEHGLDRELVGEIVAGGLERSDRGGLAGDGALEQDGARVGEGELAEVLTGPTGLTERSNTFDQGAVLREFAVAAPQGSRVDTVRAQVGRFVGRDDVLATRGRAFTSAELVAREAALIDAAVGRRGQGVAQLEPGAIERAIASSERVLNGDQVAAVRAVAGSGNGVDVIEALAGTGKTYTAGVLAELYEEAGYTVVGVAPTARAARELAEQAGIPSRTLDSRVLAINAGRDPPPDSVVIFDEAGMASTRLSEQLLAHAAKVGAKVIAIGDPGQLASVRAGGWLRTIAERLGAVRLTEVMRQRDPAERLALAALHDGDPGRWIEWATHAGRVEVVPDDRGVLAQAVGEWAAGAARHGVEQSVLICRDNETRQALNALAREHRRAAGELGEERSYGPVTVAVGDRVICRNNERDLDIDNGTRGTVRHVDERGVVIETDAHLVRELPAGYVAEHVEHAYALTGHGMQGATVEHATVVASPHDLSRGWSYTALSRARGDTQLLVRDGEPSTRGRDEYAPAGRTLTRQHAEVLGRVGRQMLVRDDEDLAIDQLAVAGRPDDPQLAHAGVEPLQEQTTTRGELPSDPPVRSALGVLRDRLERLRAQLAALPTAEIESLDALDARAGALTERRDLLRGELERLPISRERRFARNQDPHVVDRTRLTSAMAGTEGQLERTLTQRATLARELGDPAAIREERESLTSAIDTLAHQHTELRNQLADLEVQQRPQWARDALGERPERTADAESWDRAARTLARYRIEYETPEHGDPLGTRPADPQQRDDYERALRAGDQLAQELGRQAPGHELDIDR
jgi:conjugative relaxase-like TrwC/TraI family protein